MKQNKIIALTGGIGSGKSTALEIIFSLGYGAVSCDDITRRLYNKRKVLKEIKKIFPTAVSGKIKLVADKKEIAKLAFNDSVKYKALTDYLTPVIFSVAIKKAKKLGGLVFVEVPILFEMGYQDKFSNVIVITRKLEDRINAVMARSKLSKQQVLDRITSQVDYDKMDLSSYIVIENDGDKNKLKENLIKAIKKVDD